MTQRRPHTSKTNFTLAKRTALARSHAYKWPIDGGQRLSALRDLVSVGPADRCEWQVLEPPTPPKTIPGNVGFHSSLVISLGTWMAPFWKAPMPEKRRAAWRMTIGLESFIGGQRSIACGAGAADKAVVYWGLVSAQTQKVSCNVRWPAFEQSCVCESVTHQIYQITWSQTVQKLHLCILFTSRCTY